MSFVCPVASEADTAKRLPAIRACIFDMDGLLIGIVEIPVTALPEYKFQHYGLKFQVDSEDMYTICTNEILREYGKPDLPWKIKAQLQGRPGPEVRLSQHR